MLNKDKLRDFVLSVLDDDHGISEQAWQSLQELLQGCGEFYLIGELAAQVEACDGRYYLKDGARIVSHTICVLDDGETWSGEGFTIEVSSKQYQRICDGENPHEVVPLPGFPPPDKQEKE